MGFKNQEPSATLALVNDALTVGCDNSGNNRVVGIQLVDGGSFSGTVSFEATIDGTTWIATAANTAAAPASVITSTVAMGLFQIPCSGYKLVRARFSTATAGTILAYGCPPNGP